MQKSILLKAMRTDSVRIIVASDLLMNLQEAISEQL